MSANESRPPSSEQAGDENSKRIAREAPSPETIRVIADLLAERDALARKCEWLERDLSSWNAINGEHKVSETETIKCHPMVGVNVWRGEEWVAFHQCTLNEFHATLNDIQSHLSQGGVINDKKEKNNALL